MNYKFRIRRLPFFSYFKSLKQKYEIARWKNAGCPTPPPDAVKQRTLLHKIEENGINVFIETGTYFGDTTCIISKHITKVFTIEIKRDYWEYAVKRFKNTKNVEVLLGDSGSIIKDILDRLEEKALFWLDGHYNSLTESKTGQITPIYKELDEIYSHKIKDHVLLIDDARLFTGLNGYPFLEELIEFIHSKNPSANINIEHDIITVMN